MPCTDDAASGAATLYLIRHGRTAGNRRHYVGWQDIELDPTGRDQAARLAHALASQSLHAVYSSTLARARQTAEPLTTRGGAGGAQVLPLYTRSELMEIDYGEFTGLSKAVVSLRLKHDYLTQPLPGGESLADVHVRVMRFAAELVPRVHRGESVAVVAHYRSLQLLRGLIAGESLTQTLAGSDYKPANGSVLRMTALPGSEPGRFRIVSMAYTAGFGSDAAPDCRADA